MGCDVCYTNHAEADQDDMDVLLTLLGVAGVNYIMGVPGADDVMLNYQSTSFHDALYVRRVLRTASLRRSLKHGSRATTFNALFSKPINPKGSYPYEPRRRSKIEPHPRPQASARAPFAHADASPRGPGSHRHQS